jgi:hypothetical protein
MMMILMKKSSSRGTITIAAMTTMIKGPAWLVAAFFWSQSFSTRWSYRINKDVCTCHIFFTIVCTFELVSPTLKLCCVWLQ